MNGNNGQTSNENLIAKINTPFIFYFIIFAIIFFTVILFLIAFDNNFRLFSSSKSNEEVISNIFGVLFFALLVFGVCIVLLPNITELKSLFAQINNVTYIILFTIFIILFYGITSGLPNSIFTTYSYLIMPFIIGLGCFSFYKGLSDNYVDKFNLNYEKIKMVIILLCFISILFALYVINPINIVHYFGNALIIPLMMFIFMFLYVIILLTLPSSQSANLSNAFSSGKLYTTILFSVFIMITAGLILITPDSFFGSQEKTAAVTTILLIIGILWTVLFSANFLSEAIAPVVDLGKLNIFKKSLTMLFGLLISGLTIYWISYSIENYSGNSGVLSLILNMLLISCILGLVYKTIYAKFPVGNSKKNAFFELLSNTIMYIPCLISGVFNYTTSLMSAIPVSSRNETSRSSIAMLIFSIILGILYLKIPTVANKAYTQGGTQLISKPINTNSLTNLGGYQSISGNETYDYQFAISCWFYIDSAPPNLNPNYIKYTSLLNFGDKPNVLYNGKKHQLMITMQQKNLQGVSKNEMIDYDENGNRIIYINNNVLLQKWNNLIINYNGGTLDIFLNGELVKSSIGVVPYYTYDNLTIGDTNGIMGGMCNVIYFKKPLTSQNIYYLYNTVKQFTPPII